MSTYTTYLISGASRGLGLETARQLLAQSQQNRIIAAARSPEKAELLQQLIKENPGRIEAVAIDVADPATIKSGIAAVEKMDMAKSGIDVLINNAGVASTPNALQADLEEIKRQMDINVYGAINLTLAALPLLRAGREKKIFTTSSTMGSLTHAPEYPFAAGYSLTKSAVNMYFVKLALDLKPGGITVILHCPGYVKTDMNGGVDGPASFLPEESVSRTVKNVLSRGFEDTGKFFNQDGETVAW